MRKSGKNNSFHKQKFGDEILLVVSDYLKVKLGDPHLKWVSFTKVELSYDNSLANIFWDTFDPSKRGDIKLSLDKVESKTRHHLAQKLSVRHVPKLKFIYDSQYEAEKHIDDLLHEDPDKSST